MDMHEKIRFLREKHGLTLDEIAKAVGVSKGTVWKWEKGDIANMRRDKIAKLSEVLKTTPAYLMGWDEKQDFSPAIPGRALQYRRGRRLPVLGSIPAGVPMLAEENIEGYDFADVPENEDYFFLRVRGNSMIDAHIFDGELVLVRAQSFAENGQVVVCLVNGDEATLKRYQQKEDVVVLMPANQEYEPIIVSSKDFESGYARILGVVAEVRRKLL